MRKYRSRDEWEEDWQTIECWECDGEGCKDCNDTGERYERRLPQKKCRHGLVGKCPSCTEETSFEMVRHGDCRRTNKVLRDSVETIREHIAGDGDLTCVFRQFVEALRAGCRDLTEEEVDEITQSMIERR